MKHAMVIGVCCLAFGAGLVARQGQGMAPGQGAAPNLVGEVQRQYTTVSTNASKAAEQFPEDKYKWQPTPDVRTWAQLVAHMTDDANGNCWQIAGLTARPAGVERGTPAPNDVSKADLVTGFKAAIDVCQKAFAAVTPENMLQPSGGRGNASKIGQLITITTHANEHYGNMVTYMRLQGLVPPSSQRGGGPAARQ
ncbi:MAG: DinB family protein [Vicinamibacterales bacterium]